MSDIFYIFVTIRKNSNTLEKASSSFGFIFISNSFSIMKSNHIIFVFFASCLFFCSCAKESIDSANLEGTWWASKVEMVFDGKVVGSESGNGFDNYSTMTFLNGSVSIDDGEEIQRFPYTYSGNVITMMVYLFPIQMVVKTLSKSELVLDIPVFSYDSDFDGEYFSTFKGKTIYSNSDSYLFGDTYWYISKGGIQICAPIDENDSNKGWVDTYRIYYKK